MGTLLNDIAKYSDWVSNALTQSGYNADFSPTSLWEIDRFFDEHTRNGKALPNGLLAQDLGSRMFAVGSYIGEVIRKNQGGKWKTNDDDPKGEINVQLEVNGGTCWPVRRAMKRLKNGQEDSIAAYALGLGVEVGPQPKRRSGKKWWKFW